MKLTIGSNIAALKAQRQLAQANEKLSTILERLASGQRINRAADDPASLALADSLRSDVRVYTQGIRNLNDGLSLLNIADAAIQDLTGVVTRIQELTEQAANGAYGSAQRKALDAEAQALSDEFTRIVQSTEFNDKRLFTGSLGSVQLQAGIGANSIIASGLGGAIGNGTFATASAISGSGSSALTPGDFNGDGIEDLASLTGSGDVLIQLGTGSGGFSSPTTYTTYGAQNHIITTDFNNDGILDLATVRSGASFSVSLGNGDGTFSAFTSRQYAGMGSGIASGDINGDGYEDVVVTSLNAYTFVYYNQGNGTFGSGVTINTGGIVSDVAIGDLNGDGTEDVVFTFPTTPGLGIFMNNGGGTFKSPTFVVTGASLLDVQLADLNNDGILDIITPGSTRLGNGDGTYGAETAISGTSRALILDANGDGILDIATNTNLYLGTGGGAFSAPTAFSGAARMEASDFNGDGVADIVVSGASILFGNSVDGIGALLPFSLKTLAGARQAMGDLERKLENLSLQRATIGAFQSRVGFAINTLGSTVENYKAAESRIRDADIAEEASQLVRQKILTQAAAAVLAQANQQPSLVLKLLEQTE